MNQSINFPNLHIYLEKVGKQIFIGNFPIAFYGMVIAFAVLMGIFIACREAKRTGQNPEIYMDLAIYEVILCVIGARIYYVIFEWDSYKDDLLSIFNIREGGLAIYGAIITAIITAWVYGRVKKISFGQIADTACLGLVLGQAIGRWGNFFNREAFGQYTNGLFAMQLPVSAVRSGEITEEMWANAVVIEGVKYVQVHPTFLYESLWNVGLFILLNIFKKYKKFQGEVLVWYVGGYGIGRFWIESLRTDQLIIGNTGIPVSQLLAAILVIVCVVIEILFRRKPAHKKL